MRLIRFVPRSHFTAYVHFSNALTCQAAANHRRRKDLYTLPPADLEILELLGYKQKLDEVDDAILVNAKFVNQIIANPEIFGHDISALDEQDEDASMSGKDAHTASSGQ